MIISHTALFVAFINEVTPGVSRAITLHGSFTHLKQKNENDNTLPHSIERHVVLVAPEVPGNTGNIGRTCLGAGACLHLIRPLGFSLGNKELKRAGLDYWHRVKVSIWENFDCFYKKMAPGSKELAVFTKNGLNPYWEMSNSNRLFLIFGSETKGLSHSILERFRSSTYHIPITDEIRCLNLSTAVGIALYESLRRPLSYSSLIP